MKRKPRKSPARVRIPDRASDMLVTRDMLYSVRDELMTKLRSHDLKFISIDKRFDSVDKRFKSIDDRFDSIESKIDSVHQDLSAKIHGITVLLEDQNHRNKIVLDGYKPLYDRQDRLDKRIDEIEFKK